MQAYQRPPHSGKPDHVYYCYDEAQNRDAGYPNNWGKVAVVEAPAEPFSFVLRNCGNPMCTQQSYALYCSTYCLETVEGREEVEPEETVCRQEDIRPFWQIVADPSTYEGTYGRLLVGGR